MPVPAITNRHHPGKYGGRKGPAVVPARCIARSRIAFASLAAKPQKAASGNAIMEVFPDLMEASRANDCGKMRSMKNRAVMSLL
jgi:hypothetical protein